MTGREAAKQMIRPYVLRGDPLQWLIDGQMGSYRREWSAQIGNYLCPEITFDDLRANNAREVRSRCRKLTARQIAGKPAGGEWEVFSLPALYEEIRAEASGAYVQGSLL